MGGSVTRRLGCLVLLLPLSGCFTAFQSVGVTAERIEPGGKGLFTVRPSSMDPKCSSKVNAPGGNDVDCNTEYLVGCDASAPEGQSFCSAMREKGPRDSIYPTSRR
jgi:hypothetical protein